MKDLMLQVFASLHVLMMCEEGQDLVEYGLLVALVALAATAAIGGIGANINTIFSTINSTLTAAA